MTKFEPTTSSYALVSMPLAETASALAALFDAAGLNSVRTNLKGSADDLFSKLEPLSMACDRALLISNGDDWTSYFNNSLLGSNVFLPVSRLAGTHCCTGLRIVKQPTATIFEAYACPEQGGEGPNNDRRSIYAAKDGKWTFGATGAPYPFEDVSRYAAKRIRDRFTAEMLDDILKGLGAPLRPIPRSENLSATLFVFEDHAPKLPRFTYLDVQAGLPWKRG